jgi:long-subunit fatty acid transport protein
VPPPVPEREIGPPPVQYNFQPPGARSLAMGASFIGLADDATASESNPAGLTILTKPEVSVHYRGSSLDNEAPDTVTGAGFATFNDRVSGLGFLSVVYPWKNAAVSLYYQRAADFRSHSFFEGIIDLPRSGDLANYDQVSTQFTVENLGATAAFKLGSKVSLGASARATRVKLDALQQTTFPFSTPLGGALDFDGFLFRGYSHPDADKTKATWNAGALFTPVRQVTLGAVYKKGAKYEFDSEFVQDFVNASGTNVVRRVPVNIPVRIPDVWGAGLALRATDNWTILAEVVQVKYSQADLGPDALNLYQSAGEGGREPLEDATEFHVGMEYTWARGNDWIFAARAGVYTDPDHDGLAGIDSKQTHVTAGGGVVVKNALQLDAAVNLADNVKEFLLSMVVRF